jgi:hypothetical protein
MGDTKDPQRAWEIAQQLRALAWCVKVKVERTSRLLWSSQL